MMRIKQKVAWITALVLLISMLPMHVTVQAAESVSLSADALVLQDLTADLIVEGFTIKATADKKVTIDGHDKVAEDGTAFTQRIKLNGAGTAASRSIHFNVSGETNVTIYAMSGSSGAERKLNLYDLGGNLIGEMDAPSATINRGTFKVQAGDYYLVSPSSGVNVYDVNLEPVVTTVIQTLGVSAMGSESITTSKEVNGFIIMASDVSAVVVESHAKTADDGTSYTQRMKLGGTGTKDVRSIHFSVNGQSEVKVYAMSSSSGADRSLNLYDLAGTSMGEVSALGKDLVVQTLTVEAGDYYLASPSSGVNVYEVIVTTGKAEVVQRGPWTAVANPVITTITQTGSQMMVSFTLDISDDGADKANVIMSDTAEHVIMSALVGKSDDAIKTASFTASESGNYTFQVEAVRNDEATTKLSEMESFTYSLPLVQPVARAFNNADGSISVKWYEINEAQTYVVEYRAEGGVNFEIGTTVAGLEANLTHLELETVYEIRVKAIRGAEEAISAVITKTSKDKAEREWNFTYFGQSISSSRNTMEMINPEDLTFKLNSCSIKDDGVTIDGKGGKFTTFHDGISYYYTVVDPTTENFELTATFTIDYINSTPDGQEGFGILAMDSLGEFGVSGVNHYTNSAGIIATKYEETVDGVKITGKDVLGTRFVTGITPQVLTSGDSAIAENGKNESRGYGYDSEDLVKTGDTYTLILKKTNTGYHASVAGEEERILYGVDKLLQLDPDHLYVGFAVARGCNVTVSDVSFTTSDPATDAPAEAEPAVRVPYTKKIDSPTTSGKSQYEFVYVSDVPGTLTVKV